MASGDMHLVVVIEFVSLEECLEFEIVVSIVLRIGVVVVVFIVGFIAVLGTVARDHYCMWHALLALLLH